MVFSSPSFLFLFLPFVIFFYFSISNYFRNFFLLLVSLLFYVFGEYQYVWVMLTYIIINYFFALYIGNATSEIIKKRGMIFAVSCNLILLAVFKYANFLVNNFNVILESLHIKPIYLHPVHLPLGVSFITFHSISYLIDIYRKNVKPQKNPLTFGLYIALFPQLIAGPIIRYKDIAEQLTKRVIAKEDFIYGIRRFIIGLGKKTLIANPLGGVADHIFAIPPQYLHSPVAWLGVISYTLQIYFDFSGYSDMAIGLSRMFGFRILENFNYPYISKSIREYWRRWHISLSNWFRDYLYIPLGGNKCSVPRSYINLVVVFFLCGLWHGASWTYVIWGLYHGVFLMLERSPFGAWLEKRNNIWQHTYMLFVVVCGFVIFRSNSLSDAFSYWGAMFGLHNHLQTVYYVNTYLNPFILSILIIAAIGSLPVSKFINQQMQNLLVEKNYLKSLGSTMAISFEAVFLTGIFFAAAMQLAANTYNPFIYFRF
jgi:alginate O-acetyltransferase complex protein AlgI